MKKRLLFTILFVSLISILALAGCNRERPAPATTPTGQTPVVKGGATALATSSVVSTRVVVSGQTPQAGVAATPVPLTPVKPAPTTAAAAPAATGAPTTAPAGGAPATSGEKTHVVQRGEILAKIAAKYGVTVKQITDRNGITNPDLIAPGQKLIIPGTTAAPAPSGSAKSYTVQPGDTLAVIATKFGVTVQAIQQANNISNANQIYTGQVLKIP